MLVVVVVIDDGSWIWLFWSLEDIERKNEELGKGEGKREVGSE